MNLLQYVAFFHDAVMSDFEGASHICDEDRRQISLVLPMIGGIP